MNELFFVTLQRFLNVMVGGIVYIIVYEIKDPDRERQFLEVLEQVSIESNQFIPKSFIVISNLDRKSVYEKLREQMTQADLLMISEVVRDRISGWLPSSTVAWVKEKLF